MSHNFLMKIDEKQHEEILRTDGVVVRESIMPEGTEYKMHWHDYYELEIVLKGKIKYIYNQIRCDAVRGYTYLMSGYDLHSLKSAEDSVLLNIRFTETALCRELADYISSGTNQFSCIFDEENLSYIVNKINELNFESMSAKPFRKIMISNILTDILMKVIRSSNTERTSESNGTVQRTVRELQRNFRNDVTLNAMAEKLSLSPNYLGSIFKKNVGMAFNEYLNILRLKYACNLLVSSDYSVKEIALSSGYNSVEYFLYAFKKYMYTTPTGYKNEFAAKH